jgi:hypothetical protein
MNQEKQNVDMLGTDPFMVFEAISAVAAPNKELALTLYSVASADGGDLWSARSTSSMEVIGLGTNEFECLTMLTFLRGLIINNCA